MRAGMNNCFKRSWFPGCSHFHRLPSEGGPIPPWPELAMLGSVPGFAVPHGGDGVGKRITWTTRADAQRQTCPQRPPSKATRVAWTWKMLGQSSYSERTGTSTTCNLHDKGLNQDILGSLSEFIHTSLFSRTSLVTHWADAESAGAGWNFRTLRDVPSPPFAHLRSGDGKYCYLWKECLQFLFFPVALLFSSWLWSSLTHPTSLESLSSWVLVITWPWLGQLGSVNDTGHLDPMEPEARFPLHFSISISQKDELTVLCPSEFLFGSHHLQL